MSFSEELPKKSYDATRKRTSAEYVKFTPEWRVVLRMMDTNARTVWKHFISQANKGRGMSANCPNVRADMSVCPLEASVRSLPKDSPERKDKVARRRFVVNVLDRTPFTTCTSCNVETPQTRTKECVSCHADLSKATFKPLNKIKIMEGGVKLFNQTLNPIQQMQADDYDGAEITDYDIVFTTSGEGRDKQISAIPQAPKPLDADVFLDPITGEKQEIFSLDDLSEPSTIEEINLMLAGASFLEILAVRDPQEVSA
jgi:hypothetical protein